MMSNNVKLYKINRYFAEIKNNLVQSYEICFKVKIEVAKKIEICYNISIF